MNERRYDIDALRSIAMFLLIFYHLGISFTSLAPYILFVQNKRVADGIWPLLNLINTWRKQLVFLIYGSALRLSFQKRSRPEILKERVKILVVPWLFGTITFATASLVITATYYEGWSPESLWLIFLAFEFNGVHLWFLLNILIFLL